MHARVSRQMAWPRAMKALRLGWLNTRLPVGSAVSRPLSSSTARSRIRSPIATPTRGAGSASVENTPKGRFWIGKWQSGATSTKDFRERSLGCMDGSSPPSAPLGIEVPAQRQPIVAVVLLQLRQPGGIGSHPLREARLEHEGHGAFKLVRLEVGVA